jgi:transposase
MVVSMTTARPIQPLPLVPPGAVRVNEAASLAEDSDGGIVFIWGLATMSWSAEDVVSRRLAAVQLVETGTAKPGEVAAGFGVDYSSVWRWCQSFGEGGVEALALVKKGPKRASKLTEDKRREIAALRAAGKTIAEVAAATGVSVRSVARVAAAATPATTSRGGELVPLAKPLARTEERQAARAGLLSGAEPVFTSGSGLPLAGSLVILPSLAETGLIEATEKVYGSVRAAFYSASALVLSFLFATLLGMGRAARAGRIAPASMGRLLGLDRGPTTDTFRRRFSDLARLGRSSLLWGEVAAHHLGRGGLPEGIVYLDGHVRAYNGKAKLQKAHLARMRIAMAATEDVWLTDVLGEAILVWTPEPSAGLVSELRRAVGEMRRLLSDESARFTVVFDRGGYSPRLFDELRLQGVDICTYRKNPSTTELRSSFSEHEVEDAFGHTVTYLLCDRMVRIGYTNEHKRRFFACRQVTRLDEKSGHQTQVITTRRDLDTVAVARAMFGRWSEENFFRYGRRRFELDGLDSYARVADDSGRLVPNPAKKAAAKKVKETAAEIAAAEAHQGKVALDGRAPNDELVAAFAEARRHLALLKEEARAIPAKVALGELHPDAARLDPERKRIMDAVRISAYNAETALCRMLRPHYRRAEDEARTLAQEIYADAGDIEVMGDRLVVRLEPLSAPHRTRALAALCGELTATETAYPGTDLTLVYEVKEG